jgi:hypothetical protein
MKCIPWIFLLLVSFSNASTPSLVQVKDAARKAGVHPSVYYALLLRETQRKFDDMLVRPWCLTVNSKYFETASDAITGVNECVKGPQSSCDIGCAAVNWKYNGRFYVSDPVDLLSPSINLSVSADILRQAIIATGDLRSALSYYNSGSPTKALKYADYVLGLSLSIRQKYTF